MPENKYKDKRYRQRVRDWINSLRHADGRAAREQYLRNIWRGNLASGGKTGNAPGVHHALWDAVVTTDSVDLQPEDFHVED